MKWLKSRQLWTIFFTFIFNGWAAISGDFDPNIVMIINFIFGAAATFFRVDARVR